MNLNENRNEDVVRALMVQEKVLTLIGVWPLNAETFTSILRWTLATLIQISTICSLSLEVYRHCVDTDDTMDAFLMDLSSVVSLSKLVIVRCNWKYSYNIVNSIVEDWTIIRDPRHRRIMTKYFEKGRFVSLTILYLGYASGASFIFKALPFDAILSTKVDEIYSSSANSTGTGFNETGHGTTYFLATYCVFGSLAGIPHGCVLILQVAQIFVNATSHCGNDGFFFVLVMHLCGQFEILKMSLGEMNLGDFAGRKEFSRLVRRHCRLALLADDLEQTFNMVIFVQLLMSALLLCVEGLQLLISLNVNDNVAALKHAILIVTMLVQLFLYAYAGDSLESQTEEIAYAAYDSPWYDSRARTAKDLILVIHRGGAPHRVTAGKFLSMNLSTFKEILKASASYLSVLRVMMDT